ncbi:hypothetical protein RJT34_24980 [Clitoria ternatea]|uniref:Uncharacterized protein n=1 Tax=Clitoria ternatea TaxID=43366 RepID=A0AAN9FR09_CLITE
MFNCHGGDSDKDNGLWELRSVVLIVALQGLYQREPLACEIRTDIHFRSIRKEKLKKENCMEVDADLNLKI